MGARARELEGGPEEQLGSSLRLGAPLTSCATTRVPPPPAPHQGLLPSEGWGRVRAPAFLHEEGAQSRPLVALEGVVLFPP